MHFVCVLVLISWTAYYQRRLRRVFPVIWKDSVEDTGKTALESYFFFLFLQKHKKKIKNKKKEKTKKTFFKLLARWSPARPASWAACHPAHHCYPVSGRTLLTRQTPAPGGHLLPCLECTPVSCAAAWWPLSPAHSHLLDNVGLGQQHWSSSHKRLQ